ncbi:MAG: YdbH domain-containing protein [Desulfobulbus sp.]
MRVIRILVVLFLLSLLAAVLLRHTGLERLAPTLLSRVGLTQVHLDLRQIDLNEIQVNSLAFTLQHPAGSIPIRLTDAVCRYQPFELLQGKLTACSAKNIEITLPELKRAERSATSTELPRLDALLQSVEPQRIPVQQLHLPQIRLHYTPPDATEPTVFSLEYTATPHEHHLILGAAGTGSSSSLHVELHQNQTGLSGTLTLDFAHSRVLLPPAYADALPTQGTLTAQLHSSPAMPLQVQATLSGLKHPLFSIGKSTLLVESKGPLSFATLKLSPSSQLSVNNLVSHGVKLRSFSLNLGGDLHLERDRWQWRLKPDTPWTIDGLISGNSRFAPLRFDDLHLDLLLDRKQLQLDATFTSPLGTGNIRAQCSHRRDHTGQGQCTLETPNALALSNAHNPLNVLASKPEAVILQGKLAFSLLSQWQPQKPLMLQVDLDTTVQQGTLMEMPFSGFSLRQQVQVLPKLQSIKNGTLQLQHLRGPVPMHDLKLITQIRTAKQSKMPVLVVHQGYAQFFEGILRLDQCSYALDGTPTTCLLQMEDLNLTPMIALHQVQGLAVSGRIQGQLPLHFSSQGLQIDHGILENAAKGGIIRYQPPPGTMQNSPLTAYALAALQDLHYQHLSAQLDYQPDGNLAVALQIQGNNPGLDNGRAVHLNLNTEQNLLSLLKSVQYSQSLSSELGRKLMKVTKPKP